MTTMARRIAHHVSRRPSVPLTAQDELDLGRIQSDPVYRRALAKVSAEGDGVLGDVRESVLLHAVVQAGFAYVEQMVQQSGYEELALEYGENGAADRKRMARRRSPGWVDSP
jgi:hypothetical protein